MSSDTLHTERVAGFLAAHPVPVRRGDVAAWNEAICAGLGPGALDHLVELLEIGSPAEQYSAMAAARALGAEVWGDGDDDAFTWLVTLPGADQPTHIKPRRLSEP